MSPADNDHVIGSTLNAHARLCGIANDSSDPNDSSDHGGTTSEDAMIWLFNLEAKVLKLRLHSNADCVSECVGFEISLIFHLSRNEGISLLCFGIDL